MIKGFENLKRTLEIYLNPLIRNYILTIYGSVILENGAIMRTMNKFHGKPWFSNVTIAMNSEELDEYITDEGLCYRQVILIMKINKELRSNSKNIALIEWYDFKSEVNPYLYRCSHIKLTKIFNIVDIEAIQDTIHIIPRFDKKNEFFVNRFIF